MRISIQTRLFFSHFFAVLLVSGSIGTYFYINASQSLLTSLQGRLMSSAALVSMAVDAAELAGVGSEADLALPRYLENLQLLRDLKATNKDIAYLYIMRKVDGRPVFVIDTDPTEAQALPGQEYEEDVPTLMAGFDGPSVDDRIYRDEWGSFLSGYAPLKNGHGQYLVGIDMRADEVSEKFSRLRISGILSLLASILLAYFFSLLMSRHFTTPIRVLVGRCLSIAQGKLEGPVELKTRDELDSLIEAFNTMSERLGESKKMHATAQAALQRARDELEGRVEERTKELTEVNLKLTHQILEREKVEQALVRAAATDALTGLLNRRAMHGHLAHHEARYDRNAEPFSILICDLDHFKRINDTHGHLAGDEVLVDASRVLNDSIRAQDVLARWGGEEFMVLLPGTDIEGAKVVAEKIRLAMEEHGFSADGDGVPLTVSIGAAACGNELGLAHCIRTADEALYEAKEAGRNKVIAAE